MAGDRLGAGDIKDDHRVLVGMAWRLTLMDAATVLLAALSAAILAWLLLWLMPLEGGGLLWLCERVAEWLGAPIQNLTPFKGSEFEEAGK